MSVRYITQSATLITEVQVDDSTSVITTVEVPGPVNCRCTIEPPVTGECRVVDDQTQDQESMNLAIDPGKMASRIINA